MKKLEELFQKGQSPDSEFIPGIKRISEELLTPVAVELNKGKKRSQRIALIVLEIARLLMEDPLRLDRIINSVDKEMLEKLSDKRNVPANLEDLLIPEGYDPEGYKMFYHLMSAFVENSEGYSKFFNVPPKPIFSLGVFLYYLFLTMEEEKAISKMEDLFEF